MSSKLSRYTGKLHGYTLGTKHSIQHFAEHCFDRYCECNLQPKSLAKLMDVNEKRLYLISRLTETVEACISRRAYLSARLFQRDLILIMVQSSFSDKEIADAYFELAELCSKVGDFRGVNKYVSRAAKYNSSASKGAPGGLGKMIAAAGEKKVQRSPFADLIEQTRMYKIGNAASKLQFPANHSTDASGAGRNV